ncbi:alpha-L-fucosidase [Microlunatus panaciterrae]|uniref:alpha-L-fucosidase n=1 Tax=Microlunatus panaciterrae TaxID=400768 RepID=A0ABS2REM9_9ACTN|nr:alpha-L-fucosidase [Microlunatus panaciterrae]MBM7797459.1 alpha-L-fucosidase [Microlunatus panaciterrae]
MVQPAVAEGPFRPSFESLREFSCPAWFRDAKFGIWSHWGAQSVPMFGDWYARHLYCEGTDQYRHHLRTYGHPSAVGYKDLVKLWKAEQFDAEDLMDRFVAAGARYFVGQAMHHDNFFNYDSALHSWNSVQMGPGKDITGLWKAAADSRGLPFGLTEHLGATFSWWRYNKGSDRQGPYAGVPYDGNDPAFEDLYLANQEHYDPRAEGFPIEPWYTANERWHQHWLAVMKEVIDRYQPDLLYSDGPLPFGEHGYAAGLEAVAHLYNTSAARHGGVNQAVYNQKDRNPEVYSVGILDIERSQEPDIKPEPWQTDTSVGDWFYNVRDVYKTPGHVIEMLIDIVAKNGNLLLNLPQRPDGTLDQECLYLLDELAAWTAICGEGIYGTRPFRVSGEGRSGVRIEGFVEDAVAWTSDDFRFTRKGNTLYAFQMRWPDDGRAIIRTLTPADRVTSVRLLGAGPVEFEQAGGVLVATLPEKRPTAYAHCLAVELERID